ncbi:MAG: hypothetical protein AAFP08_14595 [Bacteroidota bacterium]
MSNKSIIPFPCFCLFLVTLTNFTGVLLSQNTVDSLRAVIRTADDDQSRFANQVLLAKALAEDQPDSTFIILRESYQEAATKNHPAMVDISFAIAEAFKYREQLDSAIIWHEQTQELARQFDNQTIEA